MQSNKGLSLLTLLFAMVVAAGVVLLSFKVIPVYIEKAAIKKTITAISQQPDTNEYNARLRFNQQTAVLDIVSIRGENLLIAPTTEGLLIRANYQREVPLGGGISLLFKFDVKNR